MKTIGSRAEVMHSTAKKTSGGLTKKDLFYKKGRIVSRKASAAGKKSIKHLKKLGYIAKKGTFKLFRKSMVDGRKHKKTAKRSTKKRHTRRRGGSAGIPSGVSGTGHLPGSK